MPTFPLHQLTGEDIPKLSRTGNRRTHTLSDDDPEETSMNRPPVHTTRKPPRPEEFRADSNPAPETSAATNHGSSDERAQAVAAAATRPTARGKIVAVLEAIGHRKPLDWIKDVTGLYRPTLQSTLSIMVRAGQVERCKVAGTTAILYGLPGQSDGPPASPPDALDAAADRMLAKQVAARAPAETAGQNKASVPRIVAGVAIVNDVPPPSRSSPGTLATRIEALQPRDSFAHPHRVQLDVIRRKYPERTYICGPDPAKVDKWRVWRTA